MGQIYQKITDVVLYIGIWNMQELQNGSVGKIYIVVKPELGSITITLQLLSKSLHYITITGGLDFVMNYITITSQSNAITLQLL